MDVIAWGLIPYLVFIVFVGGMIWRYRFDQFGWTSRSSQMYESKMLKIGSPLFHYAILAVFFGHVVGLMIPKLWTDAIGISQRDYHLGALWVGGIAGVALLVGLAILIYRRRSNKAVFRATTWNDKIMFLVLAFVIVVGLLATFTGDTTPAGEEHNYRETVSIWFRSLFLFQPDVEAMAASTWQFKLHVLAGMLMIVMVPFTRLIHAFTVPLHFLFRPYIVYRSRGGRRGQSRTTKGRGWEPVRTASEISTKPPKSAR